MSNTSSPHVKKTITLPRELVARVSAATTNVSSFIAEACREKLESDARRAREEAMIERCRVRYAEDLEMSESFFEAEQEAWDDVR